MSLAVQQRVANQRHFIILIVTSRCIWHIPACIDALAKPGVSANDSVHSLDMHTIHIYIYIYIACFLQRPSQQLFYNGNFRVCISVRVYKYPTLNHYSGTVSDIPSGSIYGIFLFWHSTWQYLTFFLAYILTFYVTFYLASILTYFLAYILAFYLASILTFYLAFFLAYVLTFSLTFFLAYLPGISSDIISGILSAVSWEILWGWGPAGNTAIWRLQLRSGGDHSDPVLAVRVRWGTLRSSACSWGPAGTTLILSLLFGSGGEHSDLGLAVEVRRVTLWSWVCCSGSAGNTAI